MADSGTDNAPHFYEGYDFPDGNIVVSVVGQRVIKKVQQQANPRKRRVVVEETSEETLLFRVHKSLLASYSSVFADAFVVGASSASGTLDGIPVVQLPDKADDIRNLLNYIYKPELVPRAPFTQKTFAFNASLLRLSDKYDMTRIKEVVLPEILSLWPLTLAEWDQRQKRRVSLWSRPPNRQQSGDEGYYIVEPAFAIRLGRELRLPQILPSAFYALDSVPSGAAPWERRDWGNGPDLEPLDRDDFVALHRGQMELRKRMIFVIEMWSVSWFCPDHDSHPEPDPEDETDYWTNAECPREKVMDYWEGIRQRMRKTMLSPRADALDCLLVARDQVVADRRSGRTGICYGCLEMIEGHLGRSRSSIWRDLPSMFGLDVPKGWNSSQP